MKDPLEAAGMANTVEKARALDARLLRDLEQGWESMTVEEVAEHEQARRELSDQSKTLEREKGATITRTGMAQQRDTRQHVTARQKEARQKVRAQSKPQAKGPAPRRPRSGAGAARGFSLLGRGRRRRYLEQTGLPEAGRSTTNLVLQLLGVLIAASFVYVILRNAQRAPRGNSAIELVSKATVGALRRVIDPVDPLGGGNAHSASTQGDQARSPTPQRGGRRPNRNLDAIVDGINRTGRMIPRPRAPRQRSLIERAGEQLLP